GLAAFLRVPLWLSIGLGVASSLFILTAESSLAEHPELLRHLWTIALCVGGIAFASALFRMAERWLNKPSTIVDWIVDSSLVVYLVHQPFVALLAPLVRQVVPGASLGW